MRKMNKGMNLFLNFTNVYDTQLIESIPNTTWIDFSKLSGCDMYCSQEASEAIRRKLMPFDPHGIHFIDNGNYHYVTKFFLEKIRRPFSLVLFDHHNDMQKSTLWDTLSCGNWAAKIIEDNPYLKQVMLIGAEEKALHEMDEKYRDRVTYVTLSDIENQLYKGRGLRENVPLYISIDKDVLSRKYARTNWDQGKMSMKVLEGLLENILHNNTVIGADICGEQSVNEPYVQFAEDFRINKTTDKELRNLLESYFSQAAAQRIS